MYIASTRNTKDNIAVMFMATWVTIKSALLNRYNTIITSIDVLQVIDPNVTNDVSIAQAVSLT